MIELGIHTDNWRTLSGSFEAAIETTVKYGVKNTEFTVIHGQYYVTAMGYEPSVSMQSNPRAVKRYLDDRGIKVSQIDAAYPMMCPDGATYGVQYVQQAVRFAADLGCPNIVTLDGSTENPGMSIDDVFRLTCENYEKILSWAEDYGIVINVETHGPYTTNPEFLERLFKHFDSEYLRFNFDTGNTYISGHDPLEYLKMFRKYLAHCHIKDVSPQLDSDVRGEETGIACSEMAIGEGVNAENIKKCINYLKETDWNGVVSIECCGTDQNIKRSVEFLNSLL